MEKEKKPTTKEPKTEEKKLRPSAAKRRMIAQNPYPLRGKSSDPYSPY